LLVGIGIHWARQMLDRGVPLFGQPFGQEFAVAVVYIDAAAHEDDRLARGDDDFTQALFAGGKIENLVWAAESL